MEPDLVAESTVSLTYLFALAAMAIAMLEEYLREPWDGGLERLQWEPVLLTGNMPSSGATPCL